MTPTCPNCGEIKEHLPEFRVKGKIMDAATDEGLEAAQVHSVMSVPTMIFLDKAGKEVNRANTLEDIKKIMHNKSLLDV
jgi:thioredoxin-related protein